MASKVQSASEQSACGLHSLVHINACLHGNVSIDNLHGNSISRTAAGSSLSHLGCALKWALQAPATCTCT